MNRLPRQWVSLSPPLTGRLIAIAFAHIPGRGGGGHVLSSSPLSSLLPQRDAQGAIRIVFLRELGARDLVVRSWAPFFSVSPLGGACAPLDISFRGARRSTGECPYRSAEAPPAISITRRGARFISPRAARARARRDCAPATASRGLAISIE